MIKKYDVVINNSIEDCKNEKDGLINNYLFSLHYLANVAAKQIADELLKGVLSDSLLKTC